MEFKLTFSFFFTLSFGWPEGGQGVGAAMVKALSPRVRYVVLVMGLRRVGISGA